MTKSKKLTIKMISISVILMILAIVLVLITDIEKTHTMLFVWFYSGAQILIYVGFVRYGLKKKLLKWR